MSVKSQQESEQPAKVYQLDAVETKVDQALTKIDKILESVSGVVTVGQLETRLKDQQDDFTKKLKSMQESHDEDLQNMKTAIDLKYEPTYKGIWWVVSSIAAVLIGAIWAQISGLWGGK